MFLGIKKNDLLVPPTYGRILAFNEKGAEIIKAASENAEAANERIKAAQENPELANPMDKFLIPFSSSLKDILDKFKVPQLVRQAEITCRSTDLYMLASRNVRPCAADFTTKIEIQK